MSDTGKIIALIKALGGGSGGSGGVFYVNATENDEEMLVLNKTYAEIVNAVSNNIVCMEQTNPAGRHMLSYMSAYGYNEGMYGVVFRSNGDSVVFTTDSEDGYPVSNGIK